MWARDDVDERQQYQIALCQAESGRRTYALHLANSDRPLPQGTVLLTEIVPIELVLKRSIPRIVECVRLTTGEPFFVEPHNIWFTSQEWRALDESDDDWTAVPWLNGIPPLLPPK